jgi:hypothetical protein
MLDTRKMKKTTVCLTRTRSLFVCRSGRISSIEAPVVPTKDARSAPSARNAVLMEGVALRSPLRRMPPEIT